MVKNKHGELCVEMENEDVASANAINMHMNTKCAFTERGKITALSMALVNKLSASN